MNFAPMLYLLWKIGYCNVAEAILPFRVTFSVTNRCQAACGMCNIWQKPVANELTPDEIRSLFINAPSFSWINLTGGEIFQRPDHKEVFRAVIEPSSKLYLLNFPTNGQQTAAIAEATELILSEELPRRLIVSISIDGPPDIHDRIRGLPGSWQQAMETFRVLRARRSRRFSVSLGLTVQISNIDSIDDTFAACRSLIPDLHHGELHFNMVHISGHYYGNSTFSDFPTPEAMTAVFRRLAAQRSLNLLNPVHFIESRYQELALSFLANGFPPVRCQAAGASCFISPDGTIFPCSVWDEPIGALREWGFDFRGLWQMGNRHDIRTRVSTADCPRCWTPCEAYQSILCSLLAVGNIR